MNHTQMWLAMKYQKKSPKETQKIIDELRLI